MFIEMLAVMVSEGIRIEPLGEDTSLIEGFQAVQEGRSPGKQKPFLRCNLQQRRGRFSGRKGLGGKRSRSLENRYHDVYLFRN